MLEALETQLADLPEVIIVLDDLHHLSNPALISDLGTLADLVPPNVHLVLSTRVDLPIAWSRRRLRDQLTEIRQSDLAFDEVDSAVLLARITGRSLGERQGRRSGRPNRRVGRRTPAGGNDAQALRRRGRVHHPVQRRRPTDRGLPQ